MPTSTNMLEMLVWLRENPRVETEVREKYDGRTIASAERRGYVMVYSPPTGPLMMITERGEAYVVLEGRL